MSIKSVDVIIPTYKPGRKLLLILRKLARQTFPVNQIILCNTEKEYFDSFLEKYWPDGNPLPGNPMVYHIPKEEFDHGKTRAEAVMRSDADAFLCMTDDAVPANDHLVEKLVRTLDRENVAVAYARQLAGAKAGMTESYTRQFNYPDVSMDKSISDVERLGIKTYFCSNVCAMYKREIYDRLGGFIRHTIFNEDMIYAGGAVQKGYTIAYVAGARVFHSHSYSGSQQFHRNFDLGVSQAEHPEIFASVPSEGEGLKMVKETIAYLAKKGKFLKIYDLLVMSTCKYAGYLLGKNYKKLPMSIVKKCTTNPGYFKN